MVKITDVPPEVLKQLIANKILVWQNTIADAQLDAQVAQYIGDSRLSAEAAARLKQALQAVQYLGEKLDALSKGKNLANEPTPQ